MPSSQCTPAHGAARQSMHERGLAVDFTCNGGGVIGSRSSPCFQWLAGNASSYGFYNLPRALALVHATATELVAAREPR